MNRKIRVLVVDDDTLLRKLVTEQLAKGDFDAAPAASGQQALDILRDTDYDVMFLDITMPGLSGLETLREIRKLEDPPEVIMLTADTSLATGIEAMRHGAYDYLTKPATLDEMEAVIRKADEKRRLVKQNASLRSVARPAVGADDVLPVFHDDAAIAATLEDLEREHILRVLAESEGNRERAAAILGISSRTLYRKLREYGTHARSVGLATEA